MIQKFSCSTKEIIGKTYVSLRLKYISFDRYMTWNYYSPLRYPGGKSCLYPFFSRLFIENDLVGVDYVEPYAGGAGLALNLLFDNLVSNIYINDYDSSIYAFWHILLERGDDFCQWIESVSVDVPTWTFYKEILTNGSTDEMEKAKALFFLNRTNVSGVVKGGIIGGFNQTGKFKIDARFNKREIVKRINKIIRHRNQIHLSNFDGIDFISSIDSQFENLFIYLDPPYYKKGANLYMNFYNDCDHKSLALQVKALKNKWLISYDNQEFILNLYPEFRKICYKLSQGTSNRIGDEILIFPDTLEFKKSITVLQSAVSICNQK